MTKSSTIGELCDHLEERCRFLSEEYKRLNEFWNSDREKWDTEAIKLVLAESAESHGALARIYGLLEKE